MSDDVVDRSEAERYADWFKALADATRIQIVTLLARQGAALSVGEIVAAVDVGQSTVSHHLKALAEAGFVLVDREGAYSRYRLNEECVEAFPSAADVVMGRPAPARAASPQADAGRWGRPR